MTIKNDRDGCYIYLYAWCLFLFGGHAFWASALSGTVTGYLQTGTLKGAAMGAAFVGYESIDGTPGGVYNFQVTFGADVSVIPLIHADAGKTYTMDHVAWASDGSN